MITFWGLYEIEGFMNGQVQRMQGKRIEDTRLCIYSTTICWSFTTIEVFAFNGLFMEAYWVESLWEPH